VTRMHGTNRGTVQPRNTTRERRQKQQNQSLACVSHGSQKCVKPLEASLASDRESNERRSFTGEDTGIARTRRDQILLRGPGGDFFALLREDTFPFRWGLFLTLALLATISYDWRIRFRSSESDSRFKRSSNTHLYRPT
jgi:hypothetical protein